MLVVLNLVVVPKTVVVLAASGEAPGHQTFLEVTVGTPDISSWRRINLLGGSAGQPERGKS